MALEGPAGSGLSWAMATKAFPPPPELSWGRKKCSRTLENTDFSQDSKLAQASSPLWLSHLALFATVESRDVGKGCKANKEEAKTLQRLVRGSNISYAMIS